MRTTNNIKKMYRETKLEKYFGKRKKVLSGNLEKTTQPKKKEIYYITSQETLTKDAIEKKLLEFDLNPKYGPSYGIFNQFQ